MKKILFVGGLLFGFSSFAADLSCLTKVVQGTIAIEQTDVFHTGIIHKNEVLQAYPFFKNDLQLAFPNVSTSEDFLKKGLLTYVLRYFDQPLPATHSMADLTRLDWWIAIYPIPTTDFKITYPEVIEAMMNLYSCH